MGLCTYYRRFISGFVDIAKPLTTLNEEKRTFDWPTEAKTAFQALKKALCAASVLGYPQLGSSSSLTPTPAILGLVLYCPKCKMLLNGLCPTSAQTTHTQILHINIIPNIFLECKIANKTNISVCDSTFYTARR